MLFSHVLVWFYCVLLGLFLLVCQNRGSSSSWTPGLLMEHDTFRFQVPGDEENERKQWSALHSTFSFKCHFFPCNCLGPAIWKWPSCVYALLKNVIPFFFSFLFLKENIWLLKNLSIWHSLFLLEQIRQIAVIQERWKPPVISTNK